MAKYDLFELVQMYPTVARLETHELSVLNPTEQRLLTDKILSKIKRWGYRPLSKQSIISQHLYDSPTTTRIWALAHLQRHPRLTFSRNAHGARVPLEPSQASERLTALINGVVPGVERERDRRDERGERIDPDPAPDFDPIVGVSEVVPFVSVKEEIEQEPASVEVEVDSYAWSLASKCIGRYPYAIIYGPPGTGKTATAIKTLRRNGHKRVVNVYVTPETTAAELMGYSAPNESGTFVWRDGPITAAMRNGWPVVINEIDDVSGDAETALLGAMDDQDIAQYELMSGEVIVPASGYSVIATMNGDPAILRPALLDRLPIRFKIDEVHPHAFERLPKDIRKAARDSTNVKGDRRQSIRAWIAFATARDEWGLSEKDAAIIVWQDRATDMLNALKMARGK